MNPLRISLAAATLTGAVLAQGQCPPAGAFGPIDCDAATLVGLNLGVQHLNGEVFVSGASGTAAGSTYSIFVLDEAGALLRSFPQPAAVVSGFGMRDGATDGTSLMFGSELGLFTFDINGNPVASIDAANGPQVVSNPITGPGLAVVGNYRGNAFNPNGNGGNGSFFTGSFGSDIIEIDLDGVVLNTFVNGGQWSMYGCAYNAATNSLWINDDGPGNIVELDVATGLLTGRSIAAEIAVPGGLSFTDDGLLCSLDQGTPDTVETWLVAVDMLTGVDGVLDNGNTTVNVLSTSFGWDLDAPAGTPYAWVLNLGAEATICADLPLAAIPGFESLANFSSVTDFTTPSSLFFLLEPGSAGTPVSIPSPLALGVVPDGLIRVEGVYLDPSLSPLPINVSNEGFLDLNSTPIIGVTVSAEGANSFNSDTTSGFFQIKNDSADPMKAITKVILDCTINAGTLEFDTDQTGMADLLEGGNSVAVGCSGTYRNGSDVTTGLVYDASNTVGATPCDATALTGFLGTNAGNAPDDWQTLEFNYAGGTFLNGAVFEFDSDTDGGAGINGAAMAGIVVTIEFADGSVSTGVLAATGATRSEVTL